MPAKDPADRDRPRSSAIPGGDPATAATPYSETKILAVVVAAVMAVNALPVAAPATPPHVY
jgi:hypothetical protein